MFESSGGFRLPYGSVVSPDGSLVRLDRWQALTPEQRRGFALLCPDLVVELARRIKQDEMLYGGPEYPGLRLELEEIWDA